MNYKSKNKSRRSMARNGAAAVEAALLLPFLVIVSFLAIDVSQYINAAQVVANSSREGARWAARDSTTTAAEVETAVKQYLSDTLPNLDQNDLNQLVSIEVTHVDDDEDVSGSSLSTVPSGDMLNIDVTMDFSAIRWLKGPSYRTIGSSTFCRRQ